MAAPVPNAIQSPEHVRAAKRPCVGISGEGGEQAFDGLTKVTGHHHRVVAPSLDPRKTHRLERCDQRNAERACETRKPVVQDRDDEQKCDLGQDADPRSAQRRGSESSTSDSASRILRACWANPGVRRSEYGQVDHYFDTGNLSSLVGGDRNDPRPGQVQGICAGSFSFLFHLEAGTAAGSVTLERGDEVVVVGPSAAIITAGTHIGPEIDGSEMLHDVTGEVRSMQRACTAALSGKSRSL
jgi:hypothetical protein